MKRRVSQPLRSLGSSSDVSTSTITQLSASEKPNQLMMVTRTFNIPLTPEDAINGKRFAGTDVPAHLLNRPPRTPMYALAILIELPHSDSHEHMGFVTARWSVIERALDDLNRTMFHIFYDQLLQGIDAIHASRAPRARPYSDDRFASENSYLFTQTMILKLGSQKLKTNTTVAGKVNETIDRVRRGLNVPTVLNGQTKWSVWRDQIRAMRAKSNANFFPVALTATLSNNIRMLESFMSSKDKRCFAEALRKSTAWNCKALDRTVVIAADQNSARRLIFLLSAFMPSTRRSIQAVSLDSRRSSLASGIGSTVSSASNSSSTVQQPPVPSQLSQSILASTICGSPATIGQKDIPARPSMPPRQLSNSSTSRSLRREFLFPQGIEPSRSSVATTSTVTATPAIPIATRRSPKDRTPSGSPNRPGSSGSVSMNMLQKLQRNNSTNLSTSSESQSKWGSFGSGWSGLRARRESSFTERSDSGNTGEESLRSILKGGRDSTGRKSGQKLVRMVDEAQAMDVTRPGTAPIDSAMQTREATPISSRAGSVPSSHTLSSPSRPASIRSPEEPTGPPYQLQYNEWEGVIDIKSSAKKLPSSRTIQRSDSTGRSSAPSSPSIGVGAPATTKVSSADIDHFVRATGFLEAFHPDFALQAVKPYEELEAEIKAAMRAEPHPPTAKALLDTASDRVERHIDVCSTVLVNKLTGSVKRLTLQRHIVHTRVKPKKAPKPRQPSKESYSSVPEAPSWAYGPKERRPSQDYPATDMSSPPTLVVFTPSYARPPLREEATEEPAPQGKWEEKIVREEFAEEIITAADWTLVAAIDKMLADSEQRLRASSISSRSSSISGRPASRAGSITSSIMAVSQQQCKETIEDALRQIVRSVDKGKTESSSVLRQSIQKWLTQSA
ncbi:hypothetical protein M8818_004084 [Zalaria obscura]|uniref:Uncharacterized protein n=1 Tax=Zalaria obscura TaxID=2024903 RepID=A0ACC3SH73_9PEZI